MKYKLFIPNEVILIYNRHLSIYNNYYCSVIISIFHFIVGLFSTGDDQLIESYKLNNLNDTFFRIE